MGKINMNNSTNSCDLPEGGEKVLYVAGYTTLFIIGVPANFMAIYISTLLIRRENELGVYLLNLSISDLMYLLTLPFWINKALAKDSEPVNEILCVIAAVIMYINFYMAATILCYISVDRYLTLVYPFRYYRARTRKTATLLCIFAWTLEITFELIFLYSTEGTTGYRYQMCDEPHQLSNERRNILIFRLIVGFMVPVFVLLLSYFGILRAVWASIATEAAEKKKILILLSALILVYFIAFSPYQTINLIRCLQEHDCTFPKKLTLAYAVSMVLSTVNSTLDPVLYCLISETARADIKNL
uniref:G-protein coupled receptors family 1 profile domain-containing protein n=1 Tax=Latimeria chalumnae TaxID=7897 RepID=H2ZTA5_LATCH